jgi:hypothetical protein
MRYPLLGHFREVSVLGKKVVKALLSLKPSGPRSFEDLLRELLSELTSQPFFLCSSGWQGGVDGVMAEGSIGFEAKRYDEETGLDIRSLLGEIDQAVRDRSDLELWILATTGRLGTQERKQLGDSAAGHGIALLVLAEGDLSDAFHPVAGLCALLPERVCSVLVDPNWQQPEKGRSKKVMAIPIEEVRAELDSIATSPNFASFRERLQETVRELPTWRIFVESHNGRVKRAILRNSKLEFGTQFDRNVVIPRTVKAGISKWFDSAVTAQEPSLGVVLGERFDGKTWAVLDWLVDRIDTLDFPVFFLGSDQGDSLNSLLEMFRSEAERSLGQYERHAKALLNRRRRWAAGRTPWCLLILDGLNEYKRPSKPWRRHISDAFALTETAFRPCAVLCTVRKRSWPDLEGDARLLAGDGVYPLAIGSFDDTEFAHALNRSGRVRDEISALPASVQDLVRRPRFFQLVLEHSNRFGNFEAINEDVLYWLDISDKLRRDRPGAPSSWNEERYQDALLAFARKSIERHPLQWSDVLEVLESQTRLEPEVSFGDLFSEGVLEKNGRKFTLRAEHLRTGMGLYILELLESPSVGQEDLREKLLDLLSPYNDDDTAAAWLRRASVFALYSENVSQDIVDVLVDEWLRSRNRPADDLQQLKSIAPLLLRPLLRLAPRSWTRSTGHRVLQEISILIFSEEMNREKSLIQEFVRGWCRLVPARGPSYVEDKDDIQETVRTTVIEPGLDKLNLQPQGDSGLLRLQNLALYLESLSPGLLGPEDLLAIVAAHHIPFFFLSESGPWIIRQAAARISCDWFAGWAQLASSDRGSHLSQIVHRFLLLAERADLSDLAVSVEPPATGEDDPFRDHRALDRAGYEDLYQELLGHEERPAAFLGRARYLVIDPSLPPPRGQRLERLREAWKDALADHKLQLEGASTREDHFFRDAVAAVAAWMPEEGADVVRRQIEDLPRRFREGQHWWVLSIRRHAVLAEGGVRETLSIAADTPCPEKASTVAPGYALLALLPGMTPTEMVNAIVHHSLSFEWGGLYDFAARLDAATLQIVCLLNLDDDTTPRDKTRVYFLLSELGDALLSERQCQLLRRDIEDSDSKLRNGALGVAVCCHAQDLPPNSLLAIAIDKGENRKTFAPRYAAWLLIQDGHFLDHLPPYWQAVGVVVHPARREQLLSEIEGAFGVAEEMDDLSLTTTYTLPFRRQVKPSRGRLSLAEEDKTIVLGESEGDLGGLGEIAEPAELEELFNHDLQIEKRNNLIQEGLDALLHRREEHETAWSSEQFPQELVDALEETRFERWAEVLLRNPRQTWLRWMGLVIPLFRRALLRGHSSARGLWNLVNPLPHERGLGGIQYLENGIDWIFHELSRPQVDEKLACEFLGMLLLGAHSDRQLFDITLGARCQRQGRVLAVADEFLNNPDTEVRARVVRLLGWLEATEDRLRAIALTDPSLWVRDIAEQALNNRQREGFARHWLGSFLRQDLTREQRWGSGQLFLESVDGSFEAWAYQLVREATLDVRTRGEVLLLLDAAREEIKKRRSGELEKHFLGTEVSDLEQGCHPWRRQRSWQEIKRRW